MDLVDKGTRQREKPKLKQLGKVKDGLKDVPALGGGMHKTE